MGSPPQGKPTGSGLSGITLAQGDIQEKVVGGSVAVTLLSAAFGKSRVDEAHFAAQHIGGFTTEFRLLGHEIEEGLSVDVQHFRVGDCDCGKAIGVPRESGRNPQK